MYSMQTRTEPDLELRTQLKQCEPYFQSDDFGKFLQAQRRYDKQPVHVAKEGQNPFDALKDEPVHQYHLRKTLRVLPGYMQTVEPAGLSYEQGLDLLMHLFEGDKYDFTDKASDLLILTKSLDASRGDETLTRSVDKVKKLMSAGVGGSGMGGTLYSFFITSRLGLPIADMAQIIVDGAEGSYVIGPFNEALKAMLPAKPRTELVTEAFHILNGDGQNYWNAGGYIGFKQLMTFGVPGRGISVNDALAFIVTAAKSKGKRKQLTGMKEDIGTTPNCSKEIYFLPYEGNLNHFAQPYMTKKSLMEGIRDLEVLANGSSHDWVEIGEGMFVFDPKTSLWYSLGGELETPSMEEVLSGRAERVRHHFLSYDLSELSKTPFMFHVHARELGCFVTPNRDLLTYPHLQQHLTKFMTATPSRADYKAVAQLMRDAKGKVEPRSFIAHALGITEFLYPYDIIAIEGMGEKVRDIRDQTLLNPKPYMVSLQEAPFVEALIRDLNTRLPKGFEIKLNPQC